MKQLIAKLCGLFTLADIQRFGNKTAEEKKRYYQKVLDELHRNGSLPANCDLKLPKATLRITNAEKGDVLAEGGQWKRLPNDGEVVKITYQT